MTRSISSNHPFPGYLRVEYRIGDEVVWVEYVPDEFRADAVRSRFVQLMAKLASWLV